MKISKTLIKTFQELIDGRSVASSLLRKDFADTLFAEGLLTVQTHGSRKTYRAISSISLKRYLQTHYEELRTVGDKAHVSFETRYEQAAETGNSKLVKVRSCPGFPINSYEPIICGLKGDEFIINPPEGSFVFIDSWQQFIIPEDVVVVGIENMENFRMIRQQRYFFESEIGSYHFLFVSRYPQSTDLISWLKSIPNKYVHFGDFDLAGIHIFLKEFYKHLGDRSSFLIPSDIDNRLKFGSQKRYNSQVSRFSDLKSENKSIQYIIDLINKYHRCYDQEGYIKYERIKKLEVVAAIIHDGQNRIFATQRGYGDWKDYWEFPGGKMEPGETPEDALKREIWEELETKIVIERFVQTIEWDYPTFHLTMHCYWCLVESGALTLKEHEAARWLNKEELSSVNWLPADFQLLEVISRLQNS